MTVSDERQSDVKTHHGGPMATDPIFIVGTERSGSNLLRAILNAHSRIVVPHPPHVMRYFAPLQPLYGNLSNDRNLQRLAHDVVSLVRTHIYPWQIPIDADRLVEIARSRDVFGLFVGLYEQWRLHSGKPRWGCKSTFMIDYVDVILARFPAARLIFLVRDPRDVAASSKGSVFNPYCPRFTAALWRQQQTTGWQLLQRHPSETIRLVRYEDLVSEPAGTIQRLCAFLDEPFEPGLLRFFDTEEAQTGSRLSVSWRDIGKPIHGNSVGRYRADLSPREVLQVESCTHGCMTYFGYSPVCDEKTLQQAAVRSLWQDHIKDAALRLRAEWWSLLRDRNHWWRWGRAMLMNYLRLRLRLMRMTTS